MNKLIKLLSIATLALSSSIATAELPKDQGYAIGLVAWYGENCEPISELGHYLIGTAMLDNDVAADELIIQPGVIEGYQHAAELGCRSSKRLLILVDGYDSFF